MARCSRRVLLQLAATQAAALGVLAACGGSAGTSVTSGSVQATLSTAATTQTATSSAAASTAVSSTTSASATSTLAASPAGTSTQTASSATSAAPTTSATSAVATTSAVKQGGKTLTLSGYGDTADVTQRYNAVAAKFNEQFAGKYQLEPIINPFATYIDKTLTMLSSGTAPDVLNVWAQYKPSWADKGLLLDLSGRIHSSTDAAPDLYLKPMVDAMQYKGKFWGTAQDFNGQLLFLNTDLFKAKGLDLPKDDWSYDDWRQLAKQLTDPTKHVFGGTNDANEAGWQQFCIIYNYAKHYWVDDQAKKALLSDQPTIDSLTLFQQAAYNDQSLPTPTNPMQPKTDFTTGNTAMVLGWGNYPYSIYQVTSKPGATPFNWTWHTLPKGPQGQQHFTQGHLWSIAQSNTHPDDAWVLAEWAGGLQGWKAWTAVGKGQPLPMKDAALWAEYLSFLPKDQAASYTNFMINTIYQQLAVNFEYWPTYDQCSKVMGTALGQIYGKTPGSVSSAMTNATQQMNAILAGA
jgi:multiple sugar transport system substrate-binding protein